MTNFERVCLDLHRMDAVWLVTSDGTIHQLRLPQYVALTASDLEGCDVALTAEAAARLAAKRWSRS